MVSIAIPVQRAGAGASAVVTMAFCGLVAVFEGFDAQAAGVAAPGLQSTFQLTPTQMGWFFAASTLGLILGTILGGRLSDRFGRKAILIASVAAFGAMSACTAAASDVATLMAFRALTGVGLGGVLPNIVALVAENASPASRNCLLSALYAGMPAGGALVSALGYFGPSGSWRLLFEIGGFAPLAAVPLMIAFLPDRRRRETAQTGPTPRAGFGFALFGQGRTASTLLVCGSFFLSVLAMSVLLNWLPTLLVARGFTRAEASLAQMSFSVLGAAGGVLAGTAMRQVSLKIMASLSFAAAAFALALLAFMPAQLELSLAICGLVGAAMTMTQGLLYALAPAIYPTEVRGAGVGCAIGAGRVGAVVGPLLAGGLLNGAVTPEQVLSSLIPLLAIAGLTAFILAMPSGRLAAA